eukprot:5272539-Pyramimonas_sp.AAC.2
MAILHTVWNDLTSSAPVNAGKFPSSLSSRSQAPSYDHLGLDPSCSLKETMTTTSESGAPNVKLDEKAKRVRSLLSSYYGTASSQGGEAGVGKSDKQQAGQARVASIDSAAFDVKPFMNALVKGDL